jgi:hypothetical protein
MKLSNHNAMFDLYIRDMYISKLQTPKTMKLNNHNAMFDHVYQVDIYTLG